MTFSLAHVNIAPSLHWQLSLNALKRNFALFKTVFKFLTSPHQNSIKKGRISFVWNPSSKIVFGKKVRLIAFIIVYFFALWRTIGVGWSWFISYNKVELQYNLWSDPAPISSMHVELYLLCGINGNKHTFTYSGTQGIHFYNISWICLHQPHCC